VTGARGAYIAVQQKPGRRMLLGPRTERKMSTITLRTGVAEEAAPARPKRGFFRRVLDAIVESRMRKAEAELRKYVHLLPEETAEKALSRVSLKNDRELPFVR
jgi:hypothetical protein